MFIFNYSVIGNSSGGVCCSSPCGAASNCDGQLILARKLLAEKQSAESGFNSVDSSALRLGDSVSSSRSLGGQEAAVHRDS